MCPDLKWQMIFPCRWRPILIASPNDISPALSPAVGFINILIINDPRAKLRSESCTITYLSLKSKFMEDYWSWSFSANVSWIYPVALRVPASRCTDLWLLLHQAGLYIGMLDKEEWAGKLYLEDEINGEDQGFGILGSVPAPSRA